MSDFTLTKDSVSRNLQALQKLLVKENYDWLYLSSFDRWLNEYVPLEDCLRYYVTGFRGSVAEVLVPAQGKALLFVDGRYHEQAHREVDSDLVQVMEVRYGTTLMEALLAELVDRAVSKLGIVGERTPMGIAKLFGEKWEVIEVDGPLCSGGLQYQAPHNLGKLCSLDVALTGEETSSKLGRILNEGEAQLVSALDSLAWLSNLRGFQLPYQAQFRAQGLATHKELYIFVDGENLEQGLKLGRQDLIFVDFSKRHETLRSLANSDLVKTLFVDPASTNEADYFMLKRFFGACLTERAEGLVPFQAHKNQAEIIAFEEAFERSDQAIYKTLSDLKKRGGGFSEFEFYELTNANYKALGARSQSFKTIAALGSNSSIIHYSTPSEQKLYQAGELALLDSGAYYESGLATDTTRTILAGGDASDELKEIYTVVLKGLINCLSSCYPVGTLGKEVDQKARSPIQAAGYDYAHGTGHGVGINVHEGGYSLSPASEVPLEEGRVGSVEPGIYIPGKGGVRLENVVVVEKATSGELRLRSLTRIGFDWDLINTELLNESELAWLEQYEAECDGLGRSF